MRIAAAAFFIPVILAAQGPVEGPVVLERFGTRLRQVEAQYQVENAQQQAAAERAGTAYRADPGNPALGARSHGENMKVAVLAKNFSEQRARIHDEIAAQFISLAAEIRKQGTNDVAQRKVEEIRAKLSQLPPEDPIAGIYRDTLAVYERGLDRMSQSDLDRQRRAADLERRAGEARAKAASDRAGASFAGAVVHYEYLQFEDCDQERRYGEIKTQADKLLGGNFNPLQTLRARYAGSGQTPVRTTDSNTSGGQPRGQQ